MADWADNTDVDKVREVWDGFAREYGTDSRASTPDAYMVELEIRTLLRYFRNGEKVLDIGCGNGYTDIKLLQRRNLYLTGIDISPELINLAKQLASKHADRIRNSPEYIVDNVLDSTFEQRFKQASFDSILTKRAIINILTWEEQRAVIARIARLIRPGGRYIMIEATVQGHERIGNLREKFGMTKTPIRWHNRYLDENELIPYLNEQFGTVYLNDFSSTYYVGSRLIQPLLLKPFRKEPRYDFFLNNIFSRLPSIGDFGLQKLIICRKKGS